MNFMIFESFKSPETGSMGSKNSEYFVTGIASRSFLNLSRFPAQYTAPISPPMLEPQILSIGILSPFKNSMTEIWAMPFAPPLPSTRVTLHLKIADNNPGIIYPNRSYYNILKNIYKFFDKYGGEKEYTGFNRSLRTYPRRTRRRALSRRTSRR